MMHAEIATEPGSDRPNEDYAMCGPGWAVVFDGATAPSGIESGCVHDVPWLVRQLAAAIVPGVATDDAPLPDVLAEAIRATCKAHEHTCDLSNPDSPSSTVAILRTRGARLDYLVLGDSAVIMRTGCDLLAVTDDRTEHLPGGRPYSYALVRECRNAPGGFWVASTNPHAAYEAISGTADEVTGALMITDGITRLVSWYGANWGDLFSTALHQGPTVLIRRVRLAEDAHGVPYGKRHDDATALYAAPAGLTVPAIPDPLVMVR